MVKISIVYDSNFKGQTAALAECVAEGARTVEGAEVHVLHVDDVDDNWSTLHTSDALIFGSPTYIGSVSGKFKLFAEKLAGEVWLKRMWKNKFAAGFTVSAGQSGDKMNCLTQMIVFASQMAMIWVPQHALGGKYSTAGSDKDINRLAGYLGAMAQANIDEPADIAPPESDRETARMHGRHVTQVAAQFIVGQTTLPFQEETPFDAEGEGRPLTLPELSG
ncbi:MAG: flavodoxin family protein [Rhodospirillaceae bacterium]|jgi:multimeric flavodoxin WrbA|nr:flavodoxin family protein [Rhodospirillaceae bacterium]|tara:strand:- start:92 stop:751 length:660 start_codon:yes stop_codon:yes gene_type:complete